MFTVFLINFGYDIATSYNTLEDAMAAAKRACFEANIISNGDEVVAFYSPICGFRFKH